MPPRMTSASRRRGAAGVDLLLSRHLAAWKERDAVRRLQRLAATCSEGVRLIHPSGCQVGRAALSEHIGRSLAACPGARMQVVGDVAFHHGNVGLQWAWCAPDGRHLLGGRMHGELDARGLLARVVVFYGAGEPQPRAAASSAGGPGAA